MTGATRPAPVLRKECYEDAVSGQCRHPSPIASRIVACIGGGEANAFTGEDLRELHRRVKIGGKARFPWPRWPAPPRPASASGACRASCDPLPRGTSGPANAIRGDACSRPTEARKTLPHPLWRSLVSCEARPLRPGASCLAGWSTICLQAISHLTHRP